MSDYGFEVWDASGTPMVKAVDRLPSVFGVFAYSILAGSTSPLTISAPGVDTSGEFYCLGLQDLMNPICGTNQIIIYFYTGSPTQALAGNITVFQL
jgi:hypothetical protein